jgi:hypothetical protein
VIPAYARVNIPHTSPASVTSQNKAQTMCIKDEIKFLYKKKEKFYSELYTVHMRAETEWGKLWNAISEPIHDSINRQLERKYKIIDEKLKNSTKTKLKHTKNT